MRGRWSVGTAAAIVVVVAAPGAARAQEDVGALIAIIEKQPEGMERAAWKEKRRDAARKLGASGDRRAVPVLIRLAEGESFDIVGEIAIDGLGKLGDASAVPALERIAADASRDRAQRDLARKSLAKLGGPRPAPTPPGPAPTPPTTTPGGPKSAPTPAVPAPVPPMPVPDDRVAQPDDGTVLGVGDLGSEPRPRGVDGDAELPPAAPAWGDDVLGASESLTFAVGAASLGYDTLRDRSTFNLDAESHYARRLERDRSAWGITGDADVIAGLFNPADDVNGNASSRALIVDLAGGAEYRAYGGGGIYGVGQAALAGRLHYLSYTPSDPTNPPTKDVRSAVDLGVAIGGGHGRVLDTGARMRAQQLARVLERARALGRPIDDALARRLQATWWSLRRDRTAYRQLTATVAILREAGVLLGEPDAGTTYELLAVLRDPSFDGRPDGVDAQILVGESYLMRDVRYDDDADPDEGRFEMALVRVRAARQLSLASDAVATLDARYRILAPEDETAPWQATLGARWRRFAHGDHGDLLGALDAGAVLLASDDDRDDTDLGLRLAGEVGWTWSLDRASSVRVAGTAAVESKELFFGASLSAAYGFLDGTFALSMPPTL